MPTTVAAEPVSSHSSPPTAFLLKIEDSTGWVMYVKRLDPQDRLTVAFQPIDAAIFPLPAPAALARVEQIVKTWPGARSRVFYVPAGF